MTGLVIGLTVASAFLFLGAAVFFLATLKIYTEYLKAEDQRRRHEHPRVIPPEKRTSP